MSFSYGHHLWSVYTKSMKFNRWEKIIIKKILLKKKKKQVEKIIQKVCSCLQDFSNAIISQITFLGTSELSKRVLEDNIPGSNWLRIVCALVPGGE